MMPAGARIIGIAEQKRCQRKIKPHQNANKPYKDEGSPFSISPATPNGC